MGGREVEWEVIDAEGAAGGNAILWDLSVHAKILVTKGTFSLSIVFQDVGSDMVWKCSSRLSTDPMVMARGKFFGGSSKALVRQMGDRG